MSVDSVAARHVAGSLRSYFQLCKPRVVALITFTAVVGMFLSTAGLPPPGALVFGTLGIALGAASGAALNHVADRHIDALMARTSGRPLPAGDIGPRQAVLFALALGCASMAILFGLVNALTALLTLVSLIGYAVIYTMFLKRRTPQNIVLGGAAGAAPPVLGWTAVTGQLHPEALLLFLIIFVWTPPHFWSLAIRRRAEYAKAGIPMLPVTHGVRMTKLQILLYTVLLVAVTLLPFVTQMSGLIYLAGAIALGIGFLRSAILLYRSDSEAQAMKTFGYSIV
ncbi:MAG TPA: heme o synthase [Burkholderiales bacterium]